MKVRALRSIKGITKDKIYNVINERGGYFCVLDDVNDEHWFLLDDVNDEHWGMIDGRYFEKVTELTLKEKYLVSGNVVETKDGSKYLVVDSTLMDLNYDEFIRAYKFKDDLTFHGYSPDTFKIVKVYKRNLDTAFKSIEEHSSLELIWQREPEVKEVTLTELEEHFGCKVKVVK